MRRCKVTHFLSIIKRKIPVNVCFLMMFNTYCPANSLIS